MKLGGERASLEKSDSLTKKCRKRKRVKFECLVCHRQFDNDYRAAHNKTFYNAMLKENKLYRTKLLVLSVIHLKLQKTTCYHYVPINQYIPMF